MGIIAGSPECPERRQSFRLDQFHLDPPVFSVPFPVARGVEEHVLIPQFDTDLGGDIRQFIQVLDRKLPASRLFRQFGQQAGAGQFLGGSSPGRGRLVNSDRINLDVRFLHPVLDFSFGVAAVVIAAVGDHQQGFARILGLLHLVHGHDDAVQQRGFTFGLREGELVLNLLGVMRKAADQVGLSLNSTRKNSSSGFAVLKNCATAWRDLSSLFPMLPLQSKTIPMASGASSLENCTSFCSDLSSKTRKFSASRPVTNRFSGSVTVTGICTSVVSTRMFDRGGRLPTLGLGSRLNLNLFLVGSRQYPSQQNRSGADKEPVSVGSHFHTDAQPFFPQV